MRRFIEWLISLIEQLVKKLPAPETKPSDTPAPESETKPPASVEYVVTRGLRNERIVKVPCTLEFDVSGLVPTDPAIEGHLAWSWAVGHDWDGGNPQPNDEIYAASAKDYKLKVNGFGEKAFYQMASTWDPKETYRFELTITPTTTTQKISKNNMTLVDVSVTAPAPAEVWVGYGWPPSKRNGCLGSKLTNIKVTEG